MKLLFIMETIRARGAERVAAILANQLAAMSHDVYLVCTGFVRGDEFPLNDNILYTGSNRYEAISGICSCTLYTKKAKRNRTRLHPFSRNSPYSFFYNRGMYRIIRPTVFF